MPRGLTIGCDIPRKAQACQLTVVLDRIIKESTAKFRWKSHGLRLYHVSWDASRDSVVKSYHPFWDKRSAITRRGIIDFSGPGSLDGVQKESRCTRCSQIHDVSQIVDRRRPGRTQPDQNNLRCS